MDLEIGNSLPPKQVSIINVQHGRVVFFQPSLLHAGTEDSERWACSYGKSNRPWGYIPPSQDDRFIVGTGKKIGVHE